MNKDLEHPLWMYQHPERRDKELFVFNVRVGKTYWLEEVESVRFGKKAYEAQIFQAREA